MPDTVYHNQLENKYTKSSDYIHRKGLGQFFTPYGISKFMSEWILLNPKTELSILDPAAGFGIFSRSLNELKNERKIDMSLWEIDEKISSKLDKICKKFDLNTKIVVDDFLKSDWHEKFDGIIANPPYYKHHFIKNKKIIYQDICLNTNYKFSIQTNIYCWFLIKGLNLLNTGGRLAFIVPSEFLNSNYGEAIKRYLLKTGLVLHLININFEKNVFDNALTTSVIILAEKNKDKHRFINFYNVSNLDCLTSLNEFLNGYPKITLEVGELDPKRKWRNYFNGNKKNESNNLVPFTILGRFSRGIATGSNEYFTLTPSESEEYKLPKESLIPCISRSADVMGVRFSKEDFEKLKIKEKKIYLFNGQKAQDHGVKDYIKIGERLKINEKFLTRNRSPWYALEKRKVSKIWLSVFGRGKLKFVWNDTDCLNLTTFHAFYPSEFGKRYLNILFLYLNTATAREFFEQEKREYGNGLGKYEPNDINKSLVINFDALSEDDLNKLEFLQQSLLENSEVRDEIIDKADMIFSRILKLKIAKVSYQEMLLPL